MSSAAPASATAVSHQQLAVLQQQLVDEIQRQLPRFVVVSFGSILLAAFLLWGWPTHSNTAVVIWAGIFTGFLVLRATALWLVSLSKRLKTKLLKHLLLVSNVISGLMWSSAIIYFNPEGIAEGTTNSNQIAQQILLATIAAAQGITALVVYSGSPRIFHAFCIASFLPTTVFLLLKGSSLALLVLVILMLWWLFLGISSHYLYGMLRDSFMLRINNEDLISFLRDTQARTLETNRVLAREVNTRSLAESQLQLLNEELEARVAERTHDLEESQQGLTLAIEASGIALWDWQIIEHQLNHINLEPLLGCSGVEMNDVLSMAKDFIHPDDYREVKRNIVRHLRRRSPRFEARYRMRHTRGHWIWVEDRGRVVSWTSQGKPERMLGTRRDITREREAEEAQRRVDYLSNYDRLTQLANRRLFKSRLHALLTSAREEQSTVGLLFLNLDRFRQVNESLGFEVGDAILREAGRRLTEIAVKADTLARIGGDEFALIFNHYHADTLERVSEEIIGGLRQPYRVAEHEILLGASIGICEFPEHGRDIAVLTNHADLAMQQAKRLGGNQARRYNSDMRSATIEQLQLENSLRKAIFRDEFIVYYQPKLDMASMQIVGMEALVRWQHPEMGLLPPGKFIPLAEETGLISVITERVLSKATLQLKAWSDAGLGNYQVAVNIPPQQLHKGNLLQLLRQALDDSGLPAQQLEIELTESSLIDDPELAIRLFREVRHEGISIALDDFGTGYSSLGHLRHFPLDVLKIDRAFIRDVESDNSQAAIVRAIIVMAHELGMRVVAEGIETPRQFAFLKAQNCDYVQGYFISKPVPADIMETLLRDQQAGLSLLMDQEED